MRPPEFAPGALARQSQARERNRTSPNFPPTQAPSGAGRDRTQALLILRAGNVLPTSRDNPVTGSGESGPMDLGGAKRSRSPSAASPVAFWVISLVPPGEAQRSGFAGKRRSKGTSAVFATRRKRSRVDFATTSRHGQSRSPPAGGEIPPARNETALSSPPHPSRLRRATFPPGGRLLRGSAPHPPGGRLLGKVAPYGLCCVSRSRENPQSWNRRSTETQKVTASSKTTRPMA